MVQTNRYNVAGHAFALSFDGADTLPAFMQQYAPFAVKGEGKSDRLLFSLDVVDGMWEKVSSFVEEMHQSDDGAEIRVGTLDDKVAFEFGFSGKMCALLVCDDRGFKHGRLYTLNDRLSGLNSALMVMYALSSAPQDTLLLHASVVVHQGVGYLFLGHSGTGKSTHSRLWLKHISGSRLLNDDNPVVRTEADGRVSVYGSPWSGKTPCYVNAGYPVGAIVRLTQAPYNQIHRLKALEAYAALRPAVSGMRWNKEVADGQHHAETEVVRRVAIWHLECLPDADAARCCADAVAPTVDALTEKKVSGNDAALFEEVGRLVNSGSRVVLPVRGDSMLPFIIGGKESVVLEAPSFPLGVGDVVLAHVAEGKHVIHRIVKTDGKRLKLMGDGNLVWPEHCTTDDVIAQAVAVVTAEGKEKILTTNRWRWRVWHTLLPIRRYLLAIYKRIYKK